MISIVIFTGLTNLRPRKVLALIGNGVPRVFIQKSILTLHILIIPIDSTTEHLFLNLDHIEQSHLQHIRSSVVIYDVVIENLSTLL